MDFLKRLFGVKSSSNTSPVVAPNTGAMAPQLPTSGSGSGTGSIVGGRRRGRQTRRNRNRKQNRK